MGTRGLASKLLFWSFLFVVPVAEAAVERRTGTGGGGLCCFLLSFIIYRSGGAEWGSAAGAALLPGIFGWFVWRDTGVTTFARWWALVSAVMQLFGLVVVLVAALFARSFVASVFESGQQESWRKRYVERCEGFDDAKFCACLGEKLATRDEEERAQLLAGTQTGKLDEFLKFNRTMCGGTSKPLEQMAEDDSLGLHPTSKITSDPTGGKVFVNGTARGTTPLETPLDAAKDNEVRVELDGYFPGTQHRQPNANEHFQLQFLLQPAALARVTTSPPGARVLLGGKEVLKSTPGRTVPLETGETELVVLLEGYRPRVERVTLAAGETPFEFQLEPGLKVAVSSRPEGGAEVLLDGVLVGETPVEVFVAPKSTPTLEVRKEGLKGASKKFPPVARATSWVVTLVDVERQAAQLALSRARARYDKANVALEKHQHRMELLTVPPPKMERQLDALEADMQRAVTALEKAETELRRIDDERPPPPAVPDKRDDDGR